MVGLDYDDKKWDELLDQLTVEQMSNLIGKGAYGTIAMENIGKPITNEPDGPSGFTSFMAMSDNVPVYGCASYPAETVLASTWNKELANKMGVMIGNEGLIGNEKGDKLPYSGWYAPAVNVHRSPFGGRNWEYYSEDPYLSGILGSEVVKGAKTKGVYCFVKHFAINEQETNRDTQGCLNWLDEQTMREIYLKPFEMIVKEGKNPSLKDTSATQITAIRNAAHNILYTIANSCATNSEVIGYRMADWKVLLIVVDCVVFGAMMAWGAVVIFLTLSKKDELIVETKA